MKKNFLISTVLILLAILFTVLVKVVDVKPVGVNGTSIGFATINQYVSSSIKVNMTLYNITNYLGLITIFMAMVYALMGFIQLVKRKSLFKVDKEFIILGMFYIAVISLYVFFEKVIINYRPVLIDGILEASYPSSHTLITVCLCGSFIIINRKLFNGVKYINVISFIIAFSTVILRLLSGVHWFTDIVGGLFISTALLMTLYSVIYKD